ncbi:MAG: TIGR04282 family arsenosugar biosynthesis glycosyltransferase [Proteobacteria bacterium]|nr:TIGR04282 family arsenosugar biosynthesis glycosyltransferase [Pseudomonadota bacterium]
MSRAHANRIEIAIFAKAPIPGYAKTRLIPRLGADGAAKLQRLLIERAIQVALSAGIGPVSLWCAPDMDHEAFQTFSARYRVSLRAQTGNDLGERMCNAFRVLAACRPAVLIGTDCVVLGVRQIVRCAEFLLSSVDAAFVPVEDGGYILVGLRRATPSIFTGIPWGTRNVMAETERRAESEDISTAKLDPLWDIDCAEDYHRALGCGALHHEQCQFDPQWPNLL